MMAIYKLQHYIDDKKQLLIERVPLGGKLPKGTPRFTGQGVLTLTIPVRTPIGVQRQQVSEPFDFEIVAKDVKEAFELYEQFASSKAKLVEKELKQKLGIEPGIHVPTGEEAKRVLTIPPQKDGRK